MAPERHTPLNKRRAQKPAKINKRHYKKHNMDNEIPRVFKKIIFITQDIDTCPQRARFGDQNKENDATIHQKSNQFQHDASSKTASLTPRDNKYPIISR